MAKTPTTTSSPEFEALKLQVDLQDDASAGLQRLHRELQELQRANKSYFEASQKHMSLFSGFTKSLGVELRGVQKNFEEMGRHLGGATTKAAGLGFMFYNAQKGLVGFATGIRDTARFAEMAGISYARASNILEQLSRAGIDGEKGARIIAQIGQAHAEAIRISGSRMFEELRNQIRPDIANEFQRKFAGAVKREDQFNAIKEMFENIEREIRRLNATRDEGYIQEQIALGKRTAARIIGVDVEVDHAKTLNELSKQRTDLAEQRAKNAKAIAEDWDNTMENMRQIRDLFLSDAFRPDRGPAMTIHEMRLATEATYKILQTMEGVLSGHQLFDYFKLTPVFKTGMDFFSKMVDWVKGNSGQERAKVGGVDMGPLVGQPWKPPEGEGGNDDLANKLGAGSLPPLKPGARTWGWQPQRFMGGGEGDGKGWEGMRPSTNIEDHRRAIKEDTDDRETNSKLLKQVNEKLFQLLNPPGGAGAGGVSGIGGGPAAVAAALRGGGGFGGGGATGGGRGYVSDSGGGSGTRGGGGVRSSGGGGARGTSGDTGYKGAVPQPPKASTGGRYPNIENVKAAAKDQLLKEGYTEEQAEIGANGLVGQAIAESGLRSQFHDAGKKAGAAGGYVQSIYGADHARGQAMLRWMKDNNLDPNNTANQARWMAHEAQQYKGVVAELRKEHPDQGRVADVLTTDFEAPQTRYSPATQAERRRNAAIASKVGPPKEEQPQQPTTAQPSTGQPPQPKAETTPPTAPGGKQPIMIGFRGVGNAMDEAAFNAHATKLGYKPVLMDSENVKEAHEQALQVIKDNPGVKIGLYGFSKGAKTASLFVQAHPELATGKVVTVAPFHGSDISNLKGRDWDNYPDYSSGQGGSTGTPQGSGFPIETRAHTREAQQEVVNRQFGDKEKQAEPAKQGDTAAPANVSGPGVSQQQSGAKRYEPISSNLRNQLSAVSDKTGVGFDIFSGGEGHKPGDWHSGSHRHEDGGAADTLMYVVENGKKRYLSHDNPADIPKIQEVIAESKRQGITGIGVGPGYMEGHPGTAIHLGGGRATHWGGASYLPGPYEHPERYPSTYAGDKPQAPGDAAKEVPASIAHPDFSGHAGAEMDMHKVRTTIDKTSSGDREKIELTGKLKADVAAPPNVKIQIAGTGAFKKTEITRRLTGAGGKIMHPHADQGAPPTKEMTHTAGGPT